MLNGTIFVDSGWLVAFTHGALIELICCLAFGDCVLQTIIPRFFIIDAHTVASQITLLVVFLVTDAEVGFLIAATTVGNTVLWAHCGNF